MPSRFHPVGGAQTTTTTTFMGSRNGTTNKGYQATLMGLVHIIDSVVVRPKVGNEEEHEATIRERSVDDSISERSRGEGNDKR